MIDRDLVTSGFDTETIVSSGYLSYLLLAQIEAGRLPLEFPIVDPSAGIDTTILLHPPTSDRYGRLYAPDPSATLPEPISGSFAIDLFPDEGSEVAGVAFSPDGSLLVAGSWDGVIRLWDVATRLEVRKLEGHSSSVTGVAFNADGSRVASASVDGTVRLWDVETGAELSTFGEHSGPVFGVAFSPDGETIASCGSDRAVRVRNAGTGAPIATLLGHEGPILGVAFSPDGSRIASGSTDKTVRAWDVESETETNRFAGHSAAINSVSFDVDGLRIASGSSDGTVRLWDIEGDADPIVLVGHTRDVASVAFSSDGNRIASGSKDRTVRVWSAESGAFLRTLTGHARPVLSVAFSPDGSTIASGSEDAKVRMWESATGTSLESFTVVFMSLTIFTTVVDNVTGMRQSIPATLLLDFDLEWEETDEGLERNHELRISFVRFDATTNAFLQIAGIDPEIVEAAVRAQLDRTFPLGVAQGQKVQQIRLRKLIDGPRRSVGFYVNLALRSGPEPGAFHDPRGSVAFARDFRDPATPMAFATSAALWALLGPDAMFRQAEETSPGSGTYSFPLRKDPFDSTSDKIGKIKSIKVRPEMVLSLPTGRLMIDLHGEYTDAPLDPDFHLQLFFLPKITDGLVEWDIDVDVDLGLLATLVSIAGGIIFAALFLSLGGTLIVGTILGLAVIKELIAEPLAAKIVEDRLDEEAQASFLDALPFRVPGARRRWDPFYETEHQVVSRVDAVLIDLQGIAFEGTANVLGKEPVPENHVVIRDEERDGAGAVSFLRYRVEDFNGHVDDFSATAPGVDRLESVRSDPGADPTLVSLTDAQIAERIASRRILAPITYTAERIHLVSNQIDQLLCLSRRERAELRGDVIDAFRTTTKERIEDESGDEIRAEVEADLEEQLGRPPTAAEINDAARDRIDAMVDELQRDFEGNDLPAALEEAVARALRFDLAPEEMVERQLAGVLILDGKEIIVRENRDGTTTPYYRDHPDGDPSDNLLSLPHYTPPYEAPE